jgi:hypothetical protein
VAPDLRGYGRSVTQPVAYHDDLQPYSMLHRVSDVVGLVRAGATRCFPIRSIHEHSVPAPASAAAWRQ